MTVDVVRSLCHVGTIGTGESGLLKTDVFQMLHKVVVSIVDARAVRTGKRLIRTAGFHGIAALFGSFVRSFLGIECVEGRLSFAQV